MKMYVQCLVLLIILSFIDAQFSFRRADQPCPLPRIDHGRVRLRQRNKFAEFRCYPRYVLVGNKYATCRNGVWDVPKPVCAKPGCEPIADIKNGITILNYNDSWALFFCLPEHTLLGSPVAYCDGRNWNSTIPTCVSSDARPKTSCDFEDPDVCGWTRDVLHDFDWRRFNKKTPSSFLATGPEYDHTYGENQEGYYMYIESTGRIENETARLMSPVYDASLTKTGCFKFYYHMYGSATGGLRVYQKRDSVSIYELLHMDEEDKQKYLLFEKWRDQGNTWHESTSPLTAINEDFQIVIEGIRGRSYTSDIAIDDVAILQGQNCSKAAPTTTLSPFAQDTCVGRCHGPPAQLPAFTCRCDVGCVAYDYCCPDYLEVCEFDCSGPDCGTDATTLYEKPQTEKLIASSPTTQPTTTSTTTTKHRDPETIPTVYPKTTAKPQPPHVTYTASTKKHTTTKIPATKMTVTTKMPATVTTADTTTTKPTTRTTRRTNMTTTTKMPVVKTSNTTKNPVTKLLTTTGTPVTIMSTRIRMPTTTLKTPTITRTTTVRSTKISRTSPKTTSRTKPTKTTMITKRNTVEFVTSSPKPKAQLRKPAGPSSAKVGIIVGVVVLVCCAAVWAIFVLTRGARGTITLARLRGSVRGESEVRFLKADDEDN